MLKLFDIADMPNFNNQVTNGSRSISERWVFYGKLGWMLTESVNTICCLDHGACLCVAITENGRIYRCEVCNEGCYTEDIEGSP